MFLKCEISNRELMFSISFKDTSQVGQEAKELEAEFNELLRENLPGLHNSLCEEG